jgi:hypothetical protein
VKLEAEAEAELYRVNENETEGSEVLDNKYVYVVKESCTVTELYLF